METLHSEASHKSSLFIIKSFFYEKAYIHTYIHILLDPVMNYSFLGSTKEINETFSHSVEIYFR